MSSYLLLFFFALFLVTTGCVAAPPSSSDPVAAASHIQQAEAQIFQKNFAAAQKELAQAIRKDPEKSDLYLRRAELLDVLGEPAKAFSVLQEAVRSSSPTETQRQVLVHRMILLQALKLDQTDTASKNIDRLPPSSFARKNAEAAVLLGNKQPTRALQVLDQASPLADSYDQQALNLYHSALAYHRLGDEKNATGALYHAINAAESQFLIKDIERLWEIIDRPGS